MSKGKQRYVETNSNRQKWNCEKKKAPPGAAEGKRSNVHSPQQPTAKDQSGPGSELLPLEFNWELCICFRILYIC
jgi:hypothetical protein